MVKRVASSPVKVPKSKAKKPFRKKARNFVLKTVAAKVAVLSVVPIFSLNAETPLVPAPPEPGVRTIVTACDARDRFDTQLQGNQAVIDSPPSDASWVAPAPNLYGEAVQKPKSLSAPVDLSRFDLSPEAQDRGIADWAQRLEAQGGLTSMVPVGGELDPTRPLLLVTPGHNGAFSDLHGLVQLSDTYQVVVGVYDTRGDIREQGAHFANALSELTSYRDQLACEQGVEANRTLRMAGHGTGAMVATYALSQLQKRQELTDGINSRYEKIDLCAIDPSWRGVDGPWSFSNTLGVNAAGKLFEHVALPEEVGEFDSTLASLVNRTGPMDDLAEVSLPGRVRLHQFVVTGDALQTETWRQLLDPTTSLFSAELHEGELARFFEFLRQYDSSPNDLDDWELKGAVRSQGLQQLVRALLRDPEGSQTLEKLQMAARAAPDLAAFQQQYDGLLGEALNRYEGDPVRFMWENPAFLTDLRQKLA